MSDVGLFHFNDDEPSFEDLGVANGVTHWDERVLMQALGYDEVTSFRRVVKRAMQSCLSVGLDVEDHFIRVEDGGYIFTRFACYLVAMTASPSKPNVAAAQVYFAALAATFASHIDHADAVDRMLIRDELTEGNKSLASTAKRHGVTNYAFFINEGYRGLYNMPLKALCERKGVIHDGKKLMDRMGKAELAANLFRITQTDEKIKNERITGQSKLEDAALSVGKTVRETMIRTSGTKPENLPLSEDINQVKKQIKSASKSLIAPKKKEGGPDA